MKNRKKHKLYHILCAAFLAILVSAALPMQISANETAAASAGAALQVSSSVSLQGTLPVSSQAASPDQTRSGEEWTMLRDNRLEWGEITGLVEEYNPEIRREREAYRKNEDRLKTAEETSKSLARAAEEYEELAAMYDGEPGGQLTAAQLRLQAEDLREQAADNTGDKRVLWLGMQKSMLAKEKEVRNLFADYYQAEQELKENRAETVWLKKQAAEAGLRYSRGLALRSELTAAEDAAGKNAAKENSLELAKKNAFRKLITSCGWSYDAQAEIGPLPEEGCLYLTAEEKAGGEAKALENSFLLQEDRIRLENAQRLYGNGDVTQKMSRQLEQDFRKVSETWQNAEISLEAAGKSVSEAKASLELAAKACALAEKQLRNGTISKFAAEKKQYEKDIAESNVKNAVLELIRARVGYDAVCRGVTD